MSVFITNGDDYEEKPQELDCPEEDFDTLVIFPVFSAGSLAAAHSVYAKGAAHPVFPDMYVVHKNISEIACGTGRFRGKITYKGIAEGSRPARFHIETQGERSTYDSVSTPASGGLPVKTDISQPRLAVTVKYLSDTMPDTSEIGTNVTPPSPPGGSWVPPDNAFDSATDVILAFPDGWVLEKRTGPNIPGANVWLVEDGYTYYFPWRPNG